MSQSSDEDWIEISVSIPKTGPGKRKRNEIELTPLAKIHAPHGSEACRARIYQQIRSDTYNPLFRESPNPQSRQEKRIAQWEEYQLWRFNGFRTQQLVEIEAFAPTYKSQFNIYEQAKQGLAIKFQGLGLSVPIHPLYAKVNLGKDVLEDQTVVHFARREVRALAGNVVQVERGVAFLMMWLGTQRACLEDFGTMSESGERSPGKRSCAHLVCSLFV
jgi:hypothetical protein